MPGSPARVSDKENLPLFWVVVDLKNLLKRAGFLFFIEVLCYSITLYKFNTFSFFEKLKKARSMKSTRLTTLLSSGFLTQFGRSPDPLRRSTPQP